MLQRFYAFIPAININYPFESTLNKKINVYSYLNILFLDFLSFQLKLQEFNFSKEKKLYISIPLEIILTLDEKQQNEKEMKNKSHCKKTNDLFKMRVGPFSKYQAKEQENRAKTNESLEHNCANNTFTSRRHHHDVKNLTKNWNINAWL